MPKRVRRSGDAVSRISACTVESRAEVGSSAIDEFWTAYQRLRNGDPLALAAAQLMWERVVYLFCVHADFRQSSQRGFAASGRIPCMMRTNHLSHLSPDAHHWIQSYARLLRDG